MLSDFPRTYGLSVGSGFSKIEIRLHFEEGQILVGKGGEAVAVRDGLLRGEKPVVGLIQQNGGQTVGGVFYGNLSDTGLDAFQVVGSATEQFYLMGVS